MGKKGLKRGATARVVATGEIVYIKNYMQGVGYPYYTVPVDNKYNDAYPEMPYAAGELEPVDDKS